jgi:hypothetical protein
MLSTNTASADHRSQLHTETKAPIEVILARVVWFVVGVIDVLIAVRFALKLLEANAAAGFVQFVYGVSGFFMLPFDAVFRTQRVAPGAVFEWSALLAIAVYALIAWGFVALIRAVSPRENAQTVETVQKDDAVGTR